MSWLTDFFSDPVATLTDEINKLKDPEANPLTALIAGPVTMESSYIGGKVFDWAGDKLGEALSPDFPEVSTTGAYEGLDESAVKAAALEEATKQRKRAGVTSTILTSPQGVLTPATTQKTILG